MAIEGATGLSATSKHCSMTVCATFASSTYDALQYDLNYSGENLSVNTFLCVAANNFKLIKTIYYNKKLLKKSIFYCKTAK